MDNTEQKLTTSNIVESMNNLFELLDDLEDETEIAERLWNALEDTQYTLEEKYENWAKFIAYRDSLVDIRKEEIKRLQAKNKADENKIKNAKNQMMFYLKMLGQKRLETPLYTFNIQKSKASVVIEDETKIPKEFIETEVKEKVNKKELYNLLKNGEEIEGVYLKENESMRIR